ncbi:MAG TPA: sigma-70 family RNA polymerase sigma factor [Clostridia bacterium]|nr:sigma-70 family RNA polymerase sigma factor [Clostridia bacterium]
MNEPLRSLMDEEVARLAQAGSQTAFEELVSRYERRVFALVNQSCSNQADACELTQDTFVKAYRALERYDPRLCFRTWLFTIARRICIDHYRDQGPVADESLPELVQVEDPAELLARREEQRDLWKLAREKLSEAQFHALWFRYTEGMDVAEVARVLKKTRTHVKVLLFRARQTLARELEAGAVLREKQQARGREAVPPPSPAVAPASLFLPGTRGTL